MEVEIFQNEIDLGIADKIKASYISYSSSILGACNNITPVNTEKLKAIAGLTGKEQSDLLYRNAILASTGWNKNDDVFDPVEMIKAKDTPVDKQVNFMHNELDIIGHMTSSFIMKDETTTSSSYCPECYSSLKSIEREIDGNAICENNHNIKYADAIEIPEVFDIGVSFVLYKEWENQEREALVSNILDQIDTGKWFVSMECRFPRFDYAVKDETGKSYIIKRDAKSSFLSKHLRAYGGSGEYQGKRIARLLRAFRFSGKGIVDNPANERSIIFDQKPTIFVGKASLSIKEISNMDLEEKVKKLELEKGEVEKSLASVKASESDKTVKLEKVEAEYKTLADRLTDVEKTLAEKISSLTKIEDDNAKLVAKLDESQKEVNELKEVAKKNTRVSALVSAGVKSEDAETIYAKWSSLNDEQFSDIVKLHEKTESKKEDDMKSKCSDDKDADDKKDEKEAKADFSKASVEDGVKSVPLDTETKNDISALSEALKGHMKYASKASKNK